MFIPRGFQHALVLSESALFSYKVDNIYNPSFDAGVIWNDVKLNINWGVNESDLIISAKDQNLPIFNEINSPLLTVNEDFNNLLRGQLVSLDTYHQFITLIGFSQMLMNLI